jgi:Spy/CpxP family protein refolding chaperone
MESVKRRIVMRIKVALVAVLFAVPLLAQSPAPKARTDGPVFNRQFVVHREIGKWWQNADIVKKLQLSDGQLSQLDQVFYDHRMRLIDYGAEMEKNDLKLQTLLDADVPNEGQINNQVDQVLEARGKLERESTMMNLDLRKVLSLAQWRQLKSIRGDAGGFGDRIFFHKMVPPPAGPETAPLPPGAMPALPAPPPGDDPF